ncbi:5-oxoprolinase subunit PxpA [Comamonadaceae bacterium M7527]|nr:5-oxoprolinase subunit PxpA [Comamonadaceae bacterium M7527]
MAQQLINLNADLGESYGAWRMGDDAALLQIVRSANIACGFHAGDPLHMANTVAHAVKNDVSIGAHPSFADLQGFGRRPMTLGNAELSAVVTYQVGALQAFAKAAGKTLSHVKPHGAMNNMACADLNMATVIVSAVQQIDPNSLCWHPRVRPCCKPPSCNRPDTPLRCLQIEAIKTTANSRPGQWGTPWCMASKRRLHTFFACWRRAALWPIAANAYPQPYTVFVCTAITLRPWRAPLL